MLAKNIAEHAHALSTTIAMSGCYWVLQLGIGIFEYTIETFADAKQYRNVIHEVKSVFFKNWNTFKYSNRSVISTKRVGSGCES